jgi:hypothetical protein
MIAFLDRLGFSRLSSMQDVLSLTPTAFEYFTKFLMEQAGYADVRVTRKRGRYRADGGVDVKATREGRSVYVQCKRWLTSRRGGFMPIEEVRALGGVMKMNGVNEGLFVSTLPFGMTAAEEAARLNIALWGPDEISRLMQGINAGWGTRRGRSLWRWWVAVPRAWKRALEPLVWLLLLLLFAALTKVL